MRGTTWTIAGTVGVADSMAARMHRVAVALLAVATLVRVADAAPACLPKVATRPGAELTLGSIAGVSLVCVVRDAKVFGCWDIDPKSGKLTARAVSAPPGRSIEAAPDAKRCVDGYCLPPATGKFPDRVLMATSTDGQHVVVGEWGSGSASIFDVASKKRLRTFDYSGTTDATIIGNSVVGLLYLGNTLYVRGSDAGPYEAVYAIKDDGTHLGHVTDGKDDLFSIDEGAASALDADRLALTDPFFQQLVIVSAKDNRRTVIKRPFALGPCTESDLDVVEPPAKKCEKYFAKAFAPYSGAELVALPGGELLIALSSKLVGQLAILDGTTLAEKRRVRMPICRK